MTGPTSGAWGRSGTFTSGSFWSGRVPVLPARITLPLSRISCCRLTSGAWRAALTSEPGGWLGRCGLGWLGIRPPGIDGIAGTCTPPGPNLRMSIPGIPTGTTALVGPS